jgi:hypothetical protein
MILSSERILQKKKKKKYKYKNKNMKRISSSAQTVSFFGVYRTHYIYEPFVKNIVGKRSFDTYIWTYDSRIWYVQ